MKRNLIFLFVTLLLGATTTQAQKLRLNVSGGIDLAEGAIANATGGPIGSKVGLGGGLDLEVNCSPIVSLQLGAHYSQQGVAVTSPDGSNAGAINIDMVTIPLLLRLKATPKLHFLVGPQFGFVLSANSKTNGQPEQDADDQLANSDYYAVFGAGYRFTNNIFLETRFHYGFNNMAEDLGTDQVLKNRYFAFRLGYSFPLGK